MYIILMLDLLKVKLIYLLGSTMPGFFLYVENTVDSQIHVTLFREFARIVIECQPKVFIFENVKGMLSHDKGRTWETIKETFENDCDYDVYYQILNGKDYGVPHSRDRIYCIGFKKETDFKYPAPIPLTKTLYDYLQSSFDKSIFLKEKV